jgi:hypothetical protein
MRVWRIENGALELAGDEVVGGRVEDESEWQACSQPVWLV